MTLTRSLISRLFLVVGSTCIALLVCEGLCRIAIPPRPVFELGEVRKWTGTRGYTLNSLGHREEELDPSVLADKTTRILFLGDSFTFGLGVRRERDRFSDLLESRLNSDSTTQETHIYNSATPGTEPTDWVTDLNELMPIYKPHAALAIFFLRDGTRLCTSLRCYERTIAKIKAKHTNAILYRYSHLARHIYHRAIRKEFSDHLLQRISNAYVGSERQTREWRREQRALIRLRDSCRDQDVQFHLIIFPMLFNLERGYRFHGVETEIKRFGKEARIPTFSLTPAFLGHSSDSLWVSASDQHPNEKGNTIAADALIPYVSQIVSAVRARAIERSTP